MAAIAGVVKRGSEATVSEMLGKMEHRGRQKRSIFEKDGVTYGIAWDQGENHLVEEHLALGRLCNSKGAGHCAWAGSGPEGFRLHRDEFGVAPLYYAWSPDRIFLFASEVKALVPYATDIHELPPGSEFIDGSVKTYFRPGSLPRPAPRDPRRIAIMLKGILDQSVEELIGPGKIGCWLSGGLDSGVICALASRHVKRLRTFSVGFYGAPDLEFAREVARFVGSDHSELIVSVDDLLKVLPRVIYHLESFDALLVRSGLTNFLVAEQAARYVDEVFSGEGGDELFAGYDYLKSLPEGKLTDELVAITGNLHHTALQRVDRCSSAHGTIAHVPFLHPEVVRYAFTIPVGYKLHQGVGKWILRNALEGELPERVINRPESRFWEEAGVRDLISAYAGENISDRDFTRDRKLDNGWILNTKEELFYYRIFSDHFGSALNLDWMGRTPGSPVA